MPILQMLLRDERVDVNKATLDGCSPLYIAAFQGQVRGQSTLWVSKEPKLKPC